MQESYKTELLLDWLRENKDLYKREKMANKLHIGIDTLNHVLEKKKISPHSIEHIYTQLTKLLLHDSELICENALVIKIYVLALIDRYNKLPWQEPKKEFIFEELVTLQVILIQHQHPFASFISSSVNDISKEIVQIKEKAG